MEPKCAPRYLILFLLLLLLVLEMGFFGGWMIVCVGSLFWALVLRTRPKIKPAVSSGGRPTHRAGAKPNRSVPEETST